MILPIALVVGALLRFFYTLVTPPGTRAYDYTGHLDYIKYLLEHGWIPPSQAGWEFHQAPLYYVGAAIWSRIGLLFTYDWLSVVRSLQFLSVILSVITLVIACKIGMLLLKDSKEKWEKTLYLWLAVSFPGLIYTAAVISNDTTHQLISVIFLWFLLKWWQGEHEDDWIRTSATTAVGFITKASSYVFLPVSLLCLALKKTVRWPKKWKLAGWLFGIVLLLSGWLFFVRFGLEAESSRLLNLGNFNINGNLSVPTTPQAFLTFRPWHILQNPFNDTWHDGFGREYFWEFFFKSSFFGEWRFPHLTSLAAVILILGMLSAILIVSGIVRDLREKRLWNIPLFTTTAALIGSLLMYRLLHNYSPNQDFRFIPLLAVIFIYYAIRGVGQLPTFFQLVGQYVLWALVGACVMFDVLMVLMPGA